MQKYIAKSLQDLEGIAEKLLSDFSDKKVFAFNAEMGTGKTTFIKKLCERLYVTDEVTSPTFAIVNEYSTGIGDLIYHFDYYRIKDIREAIDFGSEEYFYSGSYCFIEWPEIIDDLLPESVVKIEMVEEENGDRRIVAS